MGMTLPKAMNIKKPMIKSLRVLMEMTFCITALSYELPRSALCPRSNAAWDCGERKIPSETFGVLQPKEIK
jgi:hypothetical protein